MPHSHEKKALASAAAAPVGRVLIVDDSVVARAVIARMIDETKRFMVAGAVADAQTALVFLQTNQVDIVLLDIEMPGVDGLTALPDLIVAGRGAHVLVVSSSCAEGAAATIQALSLGAADTLVKPSVGQLMGKFGDVLEEKLTRLVEGNQPSRRALPATVGTPSVSDDFDIIAIGASTGGIHALSQMLRAIPVTCSIPMLITQHLPVSFMPYFAAQIAVLAGRRCVVGTDGMRITSGDIIVAPGEAHLRCVRDTKGVTIKLTTERSRTGCMPSVDPMFETVAEVYGARALAIVLSGMGRDGENGAKLISAAGGAIVVQDKQTSVVWGMPGAVAAAGVAAAILAPAEIGRLVAQQRRPS